MQGGGGGGLCLVLSYLGNKGIYTYLGYNQRGLGGLGGSWVLQSMCNSHEWMNEFRIFNWTFCGSNSRIVILNNWLLLPLKVDAEDHVEEVMEDAVDEDIVCKVWWMTKKCW